MTCIVVLMLIVSCLALCFLCQVEGQDVHKRYAEWTDSSTCSWLLVGSD